ncbi:hypothetical protein COV20_03235 [Candidatus Woesearchaeota archaeon CG10_big_fil_rev_8_21_14_0_10_45_16]|nr:MAG: hypothetical protein COV20_03235 [Candidatus Woesearchaeota archaeon CG10_big_fil_rev_8_21_14_0_10_45_16]
MRELSLYWNEDYKTFEGKEMVFISVGTIKKENALTDFLVQFLGKLNLKFSNKNQTFGFLKNSRYSVSFFAFQKLAEVHILIMCKNKKATQILGDVIKGIKNG